MFYGIAYVLILHSDLTAMLRNQWGHVARWHDFLPRSPKPTVEAAATFLANRAPERSYYDIPDYSPHAVLYILVTCFITGNLMDYNLLLRKYWLQ